MNELNNFKPLGTFTENDMLLHIITPKDDFELALTSDGKEEIHDISVTVINAILIRVTNGESVSYQHAPMSHFIEKRIDISAFNFNSKEDVLVLVFNSINEFTSDEITSIKDSISNLCKDDDLESCRSSVLNSIIRIKKPNDRDGSVIRGL